MHLESSTAEQREWLAQQFDALPDEHIVIRPSEWAETHRYLPSSVTSLPGFYRFEVAPYLREILDCLSIDSPVREVVVQKGAQIGATVGVLENAIGYVIDHVRTAPCMLVTADAELAKLRVDSYIIPMLQFSGLDDLIRSSDEKNPRKTGRTDKKLEWLGGGFLVPFGAQNANKLRSISIQFLLRDEVDGWPDVVGKDGDPMKLVADRTAAYEGSRKILDISTPLLKNSSKIAARYKQGDQRYYYVCCLHCGHPQVLRWRRVDRDGVITGLTWQLDDVGRLVPDSVRYLCERCQHPHTNDDKTRLLSPDHGAEWRASAEPVSPDIRSYHISALYSPVGMQTWAACVHKWLEAWDERANRPLDLGKLQVFYNNVLGEPFEMRGEKVRFESVSGHRRPWYHYGEIPNVMAAQIAGSHVLLLTCQVDVHKDNLAVAVMGWCRDRRVFLVDYARYEGDTEQLDDPGTWGRLRELIESKEYKADDGKLYRVALTLVDSGYNADTVYRFAGEYESGVYPVKGRDSAPQRDREFTEFATPMGTTAYLITVNPYKDRWSAALRREWNGQDIQPVGHFNAPVNATDKQLRELTAETKAERVDRTTGQRLGWEWHRPSGAANELWDLLVYGNAALDLLAHGLCRNQLELEAVDWSIVWTHFEQHRLYYSEP